MAALADVHLQTVVVAYAGLFPAWAPAPTYDGLVEDWLRAISDRTCRVFIAEDEGGAVGTAAIRQEPGAECAQLRRLHVLPERWNSGIGVALHDRSIEAMRYEGYEAAVLWVLTKNHRSRGFYERRG